MFAERIVSALPGTAQPDAAPEFRPALFRPRERSWILSGPWLGFAGLMACGALIAVSASQTELLLPKSMRPAPSSLVGAFGHGGIDLGLGGFVAMMALLFVSYVAMVRGANRLTARPVLIGIACLNLALLLAPLMLSTDAFSYIAYGRMGGMYGVNPYLAGPTAIQLDPLYPYIGTQWIKTPTAYGPLFTALSYVFAPLSIAANVIAYKAIAAVSSLGVVLAVWSAARLRGLNPVKAVAIVGLNPVIVVYGVGGGHNDLLMLAIMLTGVYVLLRQRERASGALIVTAAAVKLTAGMMLPFALAQAAGGRSTERGRRGLLAGAGITAGIIALLSAAAFGIGPLHLLPTLQEVQSQGGVHSIPGLVLTLLGHQQLPTAISLGLDVVVLACLIWLVRRVWIGKLDWIRGAGWATVVILCTAGLLVPWYVAWLVPLAALTSDRRLLVAAVLLTGLGLTTL